VTQEKSKLEAKNKVNQKRLEDGQGKEKKMDLNI